MRKDGKAGEQEPALGAAGEGAARLAAGIRNRHQTPPRPGEGDAAALRDELIAEDAGAAPDSLLHEKLRDHLPFDLGVARLHRGPAAGAAARGLDARAFTIGSDVFFGTGEYNPASREGLGLVAHELTHVAQQTQERPVRGGPGRAASPGRLLRKGRGAASPATPDGQQHPAAGDDHPRSESVLGHGGEPPRPEMTFALPAPEPPGEGGLEPSQSATERGGGAAAGEAAPQPPAGARQADARAVADRVYDLMKQEIVLGRQRGAGRRSR